MLCKKNLRNYEIDKVVFKNLTMQKHITEFVIIKELLKISHLSIFINIYQYLKNYFFCSHFNVWEQNVKMLKSLQNVKMLKRRYMWVGRFL